MQKQAWTVFVIFGCVDVICLYNEKQIDGNYHENIGAPKIRKQNILIKLGP